MHICVQAQEEIAEQKIKRMACMGNDRHCSEGNIPSSNRRKYIIPAKITKLCSVKITAQVTVRERPCILTPGQQQVSAYCIYTFFSSLLILQEK